MVGATMSSANTELERAVFGLRSLGIQLAESPVLPGETFVSGCWLSVGSVYYHQSVSIGGLFHECGHYAVTPSGLREFFRKEDVHGPEFLLAMEEWCARHPIDSPEQAAAMNGSEQEAIAWSYAAAKRLGIRTGSLFESGFEDANGVNQGLDIHCGLSLAMHPGIHGMQAGGMCKVKTYPEMARWIQP